MTISRRQMHLGIAIVDAGVQRDGWRLPESPAGSPSMPHYLEALKTAEDACFDFAFLADGLGIRDRQDLRHNPGFQELEPMTALAAMAVASSKIGLVGTISTTFSEPYNAARQLASLDHISGGRAAWNIVTSAMGAENFGKTLPPHEVRYGRADEYLQVATSLWDSWEDNARIADKETGVYADPELIHPINFKGEHFEVEGPLNIPRSPQGRPVLIQAGSSPQGMAFGAKWADLVFTAQTTVEEAADFYRQMKELAAAAGRDANQLAILPGICPVVAATEEEALEKYRAYNDIIEPSARIEAVSQVLHTDLSGFDLDDTVPEEILIPVESVIGRQSRYAIYRSWAIEDKKTIRELSLPAMSSDGHWLVIGSGEQVADAMIERFDKNAADGFNIVPLVTPGTLNDFVEHVIPILQDRGYFRTGYTGTTLRDHLGLDRAESRFSQSVPI